MQKQVFKLNFDPLPGSVPYESQRTIRVKAKFAGLTFIDFLCRYHPPIDRQTWLDWIDAGDIRIDSFPARAARIVRGGDRFVHTMHNVTEPDVNAEIKWIYQDESILVLDKPAPLPMHPSGRFNRNSLLWLLQQHYAGEKLRIAHRLDANTTGVVVVCRTAEAAGYLQPQFERREVEKLYLVRVDGHIPWDHYRCELAITSSPTVDLSSAIDSSPSTTRSTRRFAGGRVTIEPGSEATRDIGNPEGLDAQTDFEVLKRNADKTTLLYARPFTGRTNQIRVHLWSLGFPILGDPLYLSQRQLGEQQTLAPGDAPLCLHAHRLTLSDPATKTRKTFKSPPPRWWSG